MKFKRELSATTAGELTEACEALEQNHRALISESHAFGIFLREAQDQLGEDKLKSLLGDQDGQHHVRSWQDFADLACETLEQYPGSDAFRSFLDDVRRELSDEKVKLLPAMISYLDLRHRIDETIDPEIQKGIDPRLVDAFLSAFGDASGDPDVPPLVLWGLTNEWLKVRLIKVGQEQIEIGRRMVDEREQMGEESFKNALAAACPTIPWEHAEIFMNAALDSGYARRFDKDE